MPRIFPGYLPYDGSVCENKMCIRDRLIFQHDVDPVIRQAVKLLVCPVSQVFFSPDIPDIPCNDTGDPLFPAVFCKIPCDLVQDVYKRQILFLGRFLEFVHL